MCQFTKLVMTLVNFFFRREVFSDSAVGDPKSNSVSILDCGEDRAPQNTIEKVSIYEDFND